MTAWEVDCSWGKHNLIWFSKLELQNSACLHVLSHIAHTIPKDFLHHFLVASYSKCSSTSWKLLVVRPSNSFEMVVAGQSSTPSHWKPIDIKELENCRACGQTAWSTMRANVRARRQAMIACLKDLLVESTSQNMLEPAHVHRKGT